MNLNLNARLNTAYIQSHSAFVNSVDLLVRKAVIHHNLLFVRFAVEVFCYCPGVVASNLSFCVSQSLQMVGNTIHCLVSTSKQE